MSNLSEKEFIEKYVVMVYNLALRLLGNPADAEDLAQDSLIRALKALPKFRGDSAGFTWLYRITVNTWKNRVRYEKRRGLWKIIPLEFFSGNHDHAESSLPSEETPLDSGLESQEKTATVQKALLELDEESRAVVVLRDLQNKSYGEIAEILQIPEGTVKSRLSRARESLKESLKKSYF
ncbi:MAG: sigma-70 family RNA polymerase sigma factor [Elusimicrobia bacterium]|nr:sigma-70 family RNA polymerase sigma factor [Elusimicrobiota bacterium]